MRLALVQQRSGHDKDENVKRGLAALDRAARNRAEVVCFAELAFERFHPQRPASPGYERLAEPVPGPTTDTFAAKARERAGIVVPHTRIAVEEICRTSLELAAKQCDSALAALPSPGASGPPAFETWRREIRRAFERSFGIGEDA